MAPADLKELRRKAKDVNRTTSTVEKITEPPEVSELVGRCKDACVYLTMYDLSKVPPGPNIDDINTRLDNLLHCFQAEIKDPQSVARNLATNVPPLEELAMRIVPYAFVTTQAEMYSKAEKFVTANAEQLKQETENIVETIRNSTQEVGTLVNDAKTL